VLARLDLWRRALPSAGGAFHRVVWGAAGSLGIKIVNMALVYATTLLLARLLDANGYGAYAFALQALLAAAGAQLLLAVTTERMRDLCITPVFVIR
jgi:hypothetical protein